MTENTDNNAMYNGGGLKGPLYWLAGVVTGKLALNAIQGNGILGGGAGNAAAQAANTAVAIEMAKKDSEIALLKANAETDKKLVEVYGNLRVQDKEQDAKIREQDGKIAELNTRVTTLEASSPLRERIVLDRVDAVATLANNGIATVSGQIASLAATVGSVTKVVVPNSNVCPGWGQVSITPIGPTFVPPTPAVNPPTPA